MSTINDTDQFLVQRGTDSHKQSAKDLMSTIQDTDLMLVQRGTDSYKVTCKDVKDQLGGGGTPNPPVLDSAVLTQDPPVDGNRYTSKSFTTTVTNSGGAATTLEMTGTVTGALGIKAGSDPIQSNPYTGTAAGTSVALTLTGDANLGQANGIEVGDTVTANVSYTPETDEISDVEEEMGTATAYSIDNFTSGNESNSLCDRMFDGDLNSYNRMSQGYVDAKDGIGATFDTPITPTKSLRIYCYKQNNHAPFDGEWLWINNERNWAAPNSIANVVGTSGAWVNVPLNNLANGELTAVRCGAGDSNGNNGASLSTYAISAIEVDGVILRKTIEPTGNTVIKLPTEKDIKLFQVDDVVQSDYTDGVKWDSTQSGQVSNPTRALDGNDNTFAVADGSGGEFLYIDIPSDNSTIEVLVENPTGTSSPFYIQNGDGYNNDQGVWNPGTTGWVVASRQNQIEIPANSTKSWITFTNNAADKSVARIYFNSTSSGIRVYSVKADGTVSGVKVTATDVSAKTITVDGGTWDTSNQGEVWSNYCTGQIETSSTNSYADAFDGNLNTRLSPSAGNTITFAPTTPIPCTSSLRIYQRASTPTSSCTITINTNTYTFGGVDLPQVTNQWIDLTPPSGGTLSSLSWNRAASTTAVDIAAIEVDGKLLVDAVNDSQVWSNNTAGTATPGYEWVNGFNGLLTTPGVNGTSASVPYAVLFDPPLSGTLLVKANTGGQYVYSTTSNPDPNTSNHWITAATSNLITPSAPITAIGAFTSPQLLSVEIDGKLLIDTGIRDLGDTKVSTISPKQGSGTVSDITGSVVTVSPYTDNCFVEGQWLTVDKTINVDPVTDPIASYTPGTKTLAFTGTKDLLQFANGDAVYMTDAAGTPATFDATTSAITGTSVAYNNDQVWSNFLSGPVYTPGTETRPFTGDLLFAVAGTGGTRTFTTSEFPSIGDLKIYCWRYADGVGLVVNGTDYTSLVPKGGTSAVAQWITIPETKLQTVAWSTLGNGQEASSVGGIMVDGKLLVNNGITPTASDLNTTLTFTDSTDLQYFKSGDVVQALIFEDVYGAGAGDPFYWGKNGLSISRDLDIPVTPGVSYFKGVTSPDGDDGRTTFFDQNDTQYNAWNNGTNGYYGTYTNLGKEVATAWTIPGGFAGNVKRVSFLNNAGSVDRGTTVFSPDGVIEYTSATGVSVEYVVVGNPDLVNSQMVVSGGTWNNGDTITKSLSGTGTVDSVNPSTNTMVLSASNDQWLDGYHVGTATKPAVATTAYLRFDSTGAVSGYSPVPVAAMGMDNKITPKLTFPSKFSDTDTAPDVEFADTNAYIQTKVQLKNEAGDSVIKQSNAVVPVTSVTMAVGAGQVEDNADGVAKMMQQVVTHEQRHADVYAQHVQDQHVHVLAELNKFESAKKR